MLKSSYLQSVILTTTVRGIFGILALAQWCDAGLMAEIKINGPAKLRAGDTLEVTFVASGTDAEVHFAPHLKPLDDAAKAAMIDRKVMTFTAKNRSTAQIHCYEGLFSLELTVTTADDDATDSVQIDVPRGGECPVCPKPAPCPTPAPTPGPTPLPPGPPVPMPNPMPPAPPLPVPPNPQPVHSQAYQLFYDIAVKSGDKPGAKKLADQLAAVSDTIKKNPTVKSVAAVANELAGMMTGLGLKWMAQMPAMGRAIKTLIASGALSETDIATWPPVLDDAVAALNAYAGS